MANRDDDALARIDRELQHGLAAARAFAERVRREQELNLFGLLWSECRWHERDWNDYFAAISALPNNAATIAKLDELAPDRVLASDELPPWLEALEEIAPEAGTAWAHDTGEV